MDFAPLALPEEQTLIKRLLQFPELVAGAARAREPHRVAYYLTELAGLFHPYYKAHRVITDGPRHDAGAARACAPRSARWCATGSTCSACRRPRAW